MPVPGRRSTRLVTPPIRGSCRSESLSALRPRRRSAEVTWSPGGTCTTMRIGCTTPRTPMRSSTERAWPPSVAFGHQSFAGRPTRMWNTGAMAAPRTSAPASRAVSGRRAMALAHRVHSVGCRYQASLAASQRGQSTCRPRSISTAGSSVTASRTITATTTIPARPTLRVSTIGVSSRAANPMTTVAPEVTTARPAVASIRSVAVPASPERASSSRKRVTIRSE